MQKIMSYVGCAWLVLAGTSTAVTGQEPSMPHIAMMTETAGPFNGPTRVDPVSGSPGPAPVAVQSPVPAPGTYNAGPINTSPCSTGQCNAAQGGAKSCNTTTCREVHQNYRENICIGVRPLGASVRAEMCAQVNNGIAGQMVLYNYDFNDPALGDPTRLSPYGMRRLGSIENTLRSGCACPVMIERTMSSDRIDLARQMNVVTALGEAGLAPQVVITDSIVSFSGTEALMAHESMLQQIKLGGAPLPVHTNDLGTVGSSSGGQGSGQ